MKNILLTLTICFLISAFSVVSVAQTPDEPKVCISQEAANKCVSCAAELTEARKVIENYQKFEAKTIAEREAATVLLKSIDTVMAIRDRIDVQRDKLDALKDKIIEQLWDMVNQLEKRLNRPKSGFAKFMDALKAVGYILVGVTLGRGF